MSVSVALTHWRSLFLKRVAARVFGVIAVRHYSVIN